MNGSADYVFEVSWEVCNKVGGIYTVLSSKAEQMISHYKNYFLIGPYFEHHAKTEFTHQEVPEQFKKAFEILRSENIICHYGIWDDVKGKPKTILIEFLGISGKKDSLKGKFWEDYGIDSINAHWDFEEPMLWSYSVGRLLHELHNTRLSSQKIVGHFHEWLASFGLLYLKKNCKEIATVFTTHATMLGRTLASNGIDLYSTINSIDPVHEAYRFGIQEKYSTEKAAALSADVFTTVSDITGVEAEKFFGRKPEILVYNGLDAEKFPSFEDISVKHRTSRDKIREFLTYTYFPYYTFDLDKNLIFYTVGRFEYHDKGYDLIIKTLGKLNNILKNDPETNKTITMIFWIPMEQHGLKMELLENKNYYMHIKNYINSNANEILTKMVYVLMSGGSGNKMLEKSEDKNHNNINDGFEEELLGDSFLHELKKDLINFERVGNPPFSTHNIDENNNPLVNAFKENGLLNRKEDKIKVIIEPVYLDGNDGFIELNYYDAIVGCHLGLFPSYYEPWGYTPLESIALGVPAVTTDLSGFGLFAKNSLKNNELNSNGLSVLSRFKKSEEEVINNFCDIMHNFLKLNHQQRVTCKINAKSFSTNADWKIFVNNYINAHNMALSKVGKI
ncbi:MAG TPA: glycogen/starch synthase [Alphaproteobacteria bacterium]|nr:glycogen/starch synthase [Alphaproteobacteria bacterium]